MKTQAVKEGFSPPSATQTETPQKKGFCSCGIYKGAFSQQAASADRLNSRAARKSSESIVCENKIHKKIYRRLRTPPLRRKENALSGLRHNRFVLADYARGAAPWHEVKADLPSGRLGQSGQKHNTVRTKLLRRAFPKKVFSGLCSISLE